MEERIEWADLPDSLKESISARTGPVISGRAATDGQNSPLAAVLNTHDGKVFVKGLPSDHRLVITQAREAAAAPLANLYRQAGAPLERYCQHGSSGPISLTARGGEL